MTAKCQASTQVTSKNNAVANRCNGRLAKLRLEIALRCYLRMDLKLNSKQHFSKPVSSACCKTPNAPRRLQTFVIASKPARVSAAHADADACLTLILPPMTTVLASKGHH